MTRLSNLFRRLYRPIMLMLCGLLIAYADLSAQSGGTQIKIGKLKYEGGGDWYANPSSVPNLIKFVNEETMANLAETEDLVEPGGSQIFQYPFVYMTGHGNVNFSDAEAKNLRMYLISGGFLHVDDNYGLDKYIRREMKKVFPELEWVELPFNHGIYREHFLFEKGLPKIHEHDGKPPQGLALIWEGRIVCFYTYETDLGDGWEDTTVHNDPVEVREMALQMGANILLWALNH
ncbi:DUF4159 domain-containing protein [Pontibacter sp. G13]|uniref:DUF4159 domain-containing protein n=1 Tax=Pontibacter sp. G13 TaxID=3074898 RepID=UPI0028895751|nr:DUF4159 domain-containing protein [Pontibacter sp. G13]WNJ21440.1 DUF4159 domain-containing protein [Pontibacter sp. G13]